MANLHMVMRLRKPLEGVVACVTIRATREVYLRLWLAKALMWLAVVILGARIEFVDAPPEA